MSTVMRELSSLQYWRERRAAADCRPLYRDEAGAPDANRGQAPRRGRPARGESRALTPADRPARDFAHSATRSAYCQSGTNAEAAHGELVAHQRARQKYTVLAAEIGPLGRRTMQTGAAVTVCCEPCPAQGAVAQLFRHKPAPLRAG